MLRETIDCLDQQSRSSIEETSTINESQERVTPAPESQSEKNRIACAKRSENQRQKPLGQVRGDKEEQSDTIDLDPSEFTVILSFTVKLSKGHGRSNNGVKTRATTAKETARTSKDFLIKKSTQQPAAELSRIEKEKNE